MKISWKFWLFYILFIILVTSLFDYVQNRIEQSNEATIFLTIKSVLAVLSIAGIVNLIWKGSDWIQFDPSGRKLRAGFLMPALILIQVYLLFIYDPLKKYLSFLGWNQIINVIVGVLPLWLYFQLLNFGLKYFSKRMNSNE